ncbi:MAG: hypothetical protein CVT94_15470 [Bacteroidetes bacterium HGW-Bacteroidetes-11]|nr:MAG: hypothetical protein CVT94_15470 [Bacteroidetes bacterium HGW-Bacteroidetes-11]
MFTTIVLDITTHNLATNITNFTYPNDSPKLILSARIKNIPLIQRDMFYMFSTAENATKIACALGLQLGFCALYKIPLCLCIFKQPSNDI